jgi:hypothetical protein
MFDQGYNEVLASAGLAKLAATALSKLTSVVPHPKHKGKWNLMFQGRPIGELLVHPKTLTVMGSNIDEQFRGMGLGKKLYGEVMRRQPGAMMGSDQDLTRYSARVWERMRQRPDYKTWKNPLARTDRELPNELQKQIDRALSQGRFTQDIPRPEGAEYGNDIWKEWQARYNAQRNAREAVIDAEMAKYFEGTEVNELKRALDTARAEYDSMSAGPEAWTELSRLRDDHERAVRKGVPGRKSTVSAEDAALWGTDTNDFPAYAAQLPEAAQIAPTKESPKWLRKSHKRTDFEEPRELAKQFPHVAASEYMDHMSKKDQKGFKKHVKKRWKKVKKKEKKVGPSF